MVKNSAPSSAVLLAATRKAARIDNWGDLSNFVRDSISRDESTKPLELAVLKGITENRLILEQEFNLSSFISDNRLAQLIVDKNCSSTLQLRILKLFRESIVHRAPSTSSYIHGLNPILALARSTNLPYWLVPEIMSCITVVAPESNMSENARDVWKKGRYSIADALTKNPVVSESQKVEAAFVKIALSGD